MFGWLRINVQARRTGQQLYEQIVAQARTPRLYADCGVPDTMDGRLEMVLLHTVLVLDRLRTEGHLGQRVGQRLMEELVADMDDALRRIGLGDDSVAKRIKRLGGALTERARDYGLALIAPSAGTAQAEVVPPAERHGSALEAALLDHVYRPADAVASAMAIPRALALARYVRATRDALSALPSSEIRAGRTPFPAFSDAADSQEAQP